MADYFQCCFIFTNQLQVQCTKGMYLTFQISQSICMCTSLCVSLSVCLSVCVCLYVMRASVSSNDQDLALTKFKAIQEVMFHWSILMTQVIMCIVFSQSINHDQQFLFINCMRTLFGMISGLLFCLNMTITKYSYVAGYICIYCVSLFIIAFVVNSTVAISELQQRSKIILLMNSVHNLHIN